MSRVNISVSDENISFLFNEKSIYSVLNVPLNALQGYHDHNHKISTVLKKPSHVKHAYSWVFSQNKIADNLEFVIYYAEQCIYIVVCRLLFFTKPILF